MNADSQVYNVYNIIFRLLMAQKSSILIGAFVDI